MFTSPASSISPHSDKFPQIYSYPLGYSSLSTLAPPSLPTFIPQHPLKKRKENLNCFSPQLYCKLSEGSDRLCFIVLYPH